MQNAHFKVSSSTVPGAGIGGAPLEFDLFRPEIVADPYPYYRELRERDPIHRWRPDAWLLARHRDVVSVLRDRSLSNKLRQTTTGDARPRRVTFRRRKGLGIQPSMIFLDPPDHTRLRTLVERAFMGRAVQTLRGHVQKIVSGILDAAADRG